MVCTCNFYFHEYKKKKKKKITHYYTLLHLITRFVGKKYLLLLYPWQRASYQTLRGFLLHVVTSYYTLLHVITSYYTFIGKKENMLTYVRFYCGNRLGYF